MSSTTATVTDQKKLWYGGRPPMNASYGKLMMWIFLVSDAFTFSALLITYGLIRYSHHAFHGAPVDFTFSTEYWPIPEKVFDAIPFFHGLEAPLVFVGLMTFILILSSVTMVLAVEAGHRMDRKNVEKWMLGSGDPTIAKKFVDGSWHTFEVLGANLSINQYGPPDFAALFFFITGFHGTHVFSGVVINFLIFHNTATGVYDRRGHYEMVEKVGLYWHFVDLVWVFVFTFFYLV